MKAGAAQLAPFNIPTVAEQSRHEGKISTHALVWHWNYENVPHDTEIDGT